MKFLKGLCKAILNMLIVSCICLIVLSFSVKGLFSHMILKSSSIVTNLAKEELKENVNTGNEFLDSKINEVLENKELKELVEKYLDMTLEGLVSEDALENANIEKDIVEFIHEHEDFLEEKLGIEISEDDYKKLEEQEEFHEITNEYKKAVTEGREKLPDDMKKIVDYFNFFLTAKCRVILFGILGLCLILLALLQKSFHKWINSLAVSCISSGVMLFIMSFCLDAVMSYLAKNVQTSTKFSSSVLTRNSIYVLVGGVVVLIIYKIVVKIVKSCQKNKNGHKEEIVEKKIEILKEESTDNVEDTSNDEQQVEEKQKED